MEMVKTVKPTGMMDAETASATLREFVSDGLHSRMETDYPQCYIYLLYVLYIWVIFPRTGKMSKICLIYFFLKLHCDQTV